MPDAVHMAQWSRFQQEVQSAVGAVAGSVSFQLARISFDGGVHVPLPVTTVLRRGVCLCGGVYGVWVWVCAVCTCSLVVLHRDMPYRMTCLLPHAPTVTQGMMQTQRCLPTGQLAMCMMHNTQERW